MHTTQRARSPLSNAEIATRLSITPGTVKPYVSRILTTRAIVSRPSSWRTGSAPTPDEKALVIRVAQVDRRRSGVHLVVFAAFLFLAISP